MTKLAVFLSYSHGNSVSAERAHALRAELRSHGLAVTDAGEETFPGPNILDEIERGLRSSDAIVTILGKDDVSRPWLLWELGAAAALGKPVLAVVDGQVEAHTLPMPLRLRRFLRWADASEVAGHVEQALRLQPAGAS